MFGDGGDGGKAEARHDFAVGWRVVMDVDEVRDKPHNLALLFG